MKPSKKKQVAANVMAVAEVDYDKYRDQVDVVFLAPQVRFLEKKCQAENGRICPSGSNGWHRLWNDEWRESTGTGNRAGR